VRGIDANLNNITVNGVSLDRPKRTAAGAAMDAVPADLISRIEVVKAVTPDMDHQAIGASVNIVTPSAFDAANRLPMARWRGASSTALRPTCRSTPARPTARPSGTASGRYHRRQLQLPALHLEPPVRGIPWLPAGPAGNPGASIYFPGVDALFHYDVQRWRQGVNAALEYRPDNRNQYALRISDNRFKDEEGREQSNFEFFRTAFPASFTPTTATFTGGRATVEYRFYKQKHNISTYSFEGKHTLGDGSLNLDYKLAWARRTSSRRTAGLGVPQRHHAHQHGQHERVSLGP
jgi:hypothetical protein